MGKPSREEAESAVRVLLRYAGDDPTREGLLDTPSRVVRAYGEWFGGYLLDPVKLLERTFSDVEGYDSMVVVPGIRVVSTCEHHMAPIIGVAAVGYLPHKRVVGLSKIPRVVDALARRLQVQERLTQQIAQAIHDALDPRGVGVVIRAQHHCMATRGVKQHDAAMVTSTLLGEIKRNPAARAEFLSLAMGIASVSP